MGLAILLLSVFGSRILDGLHMILQVFHRDFLPHAVRLARAGVTRAKPQGYSCTFQLQFLPWVSQLFKANRPFDLSIFPFRSIFIGPKR